MGIQGLWELLQPAGVSRSLHNIAVVDGFERNPSGKRAFRLGIDISIWYEHAQFAKGGANPDIRLLFYRLLNLLEHPILPLVVFDGRERPRVKRGSKLGKTGSHKLTKKLKEMLDAFGIEWREAKGEAEAELAFLNREGYIDAILTDDVDAFAFGAKMIIKNASKNLSGNKSNPALDSNEKESETHHWVYDAEAIRNHSEIGLTRGGLILFALLSGGDYDTDGAKGFGRTTARALARCGFGDRLLQAFELMHGQNMGTFLAQWRDEVNSELRTNSRGFLTRTSTTLTLPPYFPNLEVLKYYVNPVASLQSNGGGGRHLRDRGNLSISRLAGFCEEHFDEWASRRQILNRFRNLVWEAAVMQLLRRAALEADEKERLKRGADGNNGIRGPLTPAVEEGVGTHYTLVKRYLDTEPLDPFDRISAAFANRQVDPSQRMIVDPSPIIQKVVGYREHASTDALPQYRVVINPIHMVKLAEAGIKGKYPEPATKKQKKKPDSEPHDLDKHWISASMMRQVHPGLVQEYEKLEAEKKSGKGKQRATTTTDGGEHMLPSSFATPSPPRRPRKRQPQGQDLNENLPKASSTKRVRAVASLPGNRTRPLDTFSLPIRTCGFIFTFPDPDDPDRIILDEGSDAEYGPSDAGIYVSHDALPYVPYEPLPPPVPPPNPPANTRKESATQRKRRTASQAARAAEFSDVDIPEERREPTAFEQEIDSILGFGSPVPKKKRAPRKRARPVASEDPGSRDVQQSTKRRKPSTTAHREEIISTLSAPARAVALRQPFPELPPLDNPLDRTVKVKPAWHGEMVELTDDDDDLLFRRHGSFSKKLQPSAPYRMQESSQHSRLSSSFDDDLIEILD
ncbi:hypothetical protein BXZ70DRAFT_928765 [Cristinia sonorae]|uniref:XPG-I domain-containing protein n=1 Tax=Cristinia sonorae TaxID=1940300 RepID=A0A8K0UR58_9AGAR|nr:hypothetical protein BXZ70DRAFT_928765 [Cristinia sonorae]